MVKAAKKSAKRTKKSLVELTEEEIREQIAVIAKQRKKSTTFDKNLALATAALMRALATAEGEKRQAQKFQVRALMQFEVDQIVEHLKHRLSADDRADVARELTGEKDEESLL